MRYIFAVALSFVAQLPLAHAQDACEFEGAVIIADDYTNTALGSITNKSDPKSIFNEQGDYGRPDSPDSIWNTNGMFGNEHSVYSPRNPRTQSPPMILKDGKVVALLTANVSLESAISLESLSERCRAGL